MCHLLAVRFAAAVIVFGLNLVLPCERVRASSGSESAAGLPTNHRAVLDDHPSITTCRRGTPSPLFWLSWPLWFVPSSAALPPSLSIGEPKLRDKLRSAACLSFGPLGPLAVTSPVIGRIVLLTKAITEPISLPPSTPVPAPLDYLHRAADANGMDSLNVLSTG